MRYYIIFLCIAIVGCNSASKNIEEKPVVEVPAELPVLRAKYYMTIGDKTKDSIATIASTYFEVSLSSINNGEKYMANRTIERPRVGATFKSVQFNLVDESDKEIFFKESTDFLNYMSARGYDMVDQKKTKFGGDYTFKRKN